MVGDNVITMLQAALELERKRARDAKETIANLTVELGWEKKAQAVLQKLTKATEGKLTKLLNAGLSVLYGKDYRIKRTGKGLNVSDGYVETPLIGGRGGGLAEVVGLLVRVMAIARGRGGEMRTLLVDEPLKGIDSETCTRAAGFLHEIAPKLGMNVVIITRQDEFKEFADGIYEVKRVDGKTSVEEIHRE